MAERPALSIRIGGAVYKVHASASPEEVERLARLVDARLSQLNPQSRVVTPQMFLLVAMSFAHELEAERARRAEGEASLRAQLDSLSAELERERHRRLSLEAETRDLLRRVVARIDHALEGDEEDALSPDPSAVKDEEPQPGSPQEPEAP